MEHVSTTRKFSGYGGGNHSIARGELRAIAGADGNGLEESTRAWADFAADHLDERGSGNRVSFAAREYRIGQSREHPAFHPFRGNGLHSERPAIREWHPTGKLCSGR